ncbi:hypothetical protein [Clostridium baratii]|uniref:hypothetical protein n=1 Tax=Clostridium baratii TaxID=1561 RepID=UPI0030D296EE
MKRVLCIGLIGIAALSFVGCGENKKEADVENNKPTIEENNDKEKPEETTKTPEDKSEGETTEKPNDNLDKADKTERVFKIVTKNVDYKVVNGGEVKTVGLGVAENIKKILSTVSSKYFDNKDIELKTIDTVDNKKIAVINLAGDEKYWNQKMQGSAGGQITEYTLIENVLQREYKGYWVDGVRFTLNGKEIEDNGHIPELSKTTYR